jgi:hypothetical protein
MKVGYMLKLLVNMESKYMEILALSKPLTEWRNSM